jgi:two-component system, chemotaxis family, protein-glutamate methylesterase/glutaminase
VSAASRDLVVVGGSAGGVDALKQFVAALPADLPAAVCVALHLGAGTRSLLPGILQRGAALTVQPAGDEQPLQHGIVYVARPDTHLVLTPAGLTSGTGARENGHRPSLDVMLRSAALRYGPRVVGVVLTGMLDDGSAGLARVVRYGGAALVQDPDEAEFPSMPRNALAAVPQARALRLSALVAEVVRTVSQEPGSSPAADELRSVPDDERARDETEVSSALGLSPALPGGAPVGEPSAYSCPDCSGVLHQLEEAQLLRFRCRVGHAWSADSLLRRQGDTIEDALWTAMRALEERYEISSRLAGQADDGGRTWSSRHFRGRAEQAQRSARVLRAMLTEHRAGGGGDEEHGGAATGP